MAYTPISGQFVGPAGLASTAITFTAIATGAGNGIQFDNDGTTPMLRIRNTTGAAIVATMKTNFAKDGATLPDVTHSIPANGYMDIKRLDPAYYNLNGAVRVEAASAGLEAAVLT